MVPKGDSCFGESVILMLKILKDPEVVCPEIMLSFCQNFFYSEQQRDGKDYEVLRCQIPFHMNFS